MGKINLKRVYHIGIPVNELERAERRQSLCALLHDQRGRG